MRNRGRNREIYSVRRPDILIPERGLRVLELSAFKAADFTNTAFELLNAFSPRAMSFSGGCVVNARDEVARRWLFND